MPDLNAGLLQIGDLSGVIARGRQMQQQQDQQLLGNLGSLANTGIQLKINDIIQSNIDPNTGQPNQQAVIRDLYQFNPQIAQQYGQNLMQTQLSNQKAIADINKVNAEANNFGATAGKSQAETTGLNLDQQQKQLAQLGQTILGVDENNPQSFINAVQYAKSHNIDTSLFAGVDPYNPQAVRQAKQQAYGTLIQANDQIKNLIEQQNANSTTANSTANIMNAQTNSQNAGINQQNANTQATKVANDYDVDKTKANLEIAKMGYVSPQEQAKLSLDFQKAQNQQQQQAIENNQKIQSSVNNLQHANNMIDTFKQQVQKIVSNPLISSGGVDQNGNITRDTSGNIIPNTNNSLGGLTGKLAPMSPFSNSYKQLEGDYELLNSYAKGKGLTDLKTYSQTGATGLGAMSNQESNMVGAMQGVPDFETFRKMEPSARTQLLQKVLEAADRDKDFNNGLINKGVEQAKVYQNQTIQAPVLTAPNIQDNFGGQNVNKLYNNRGQQVQLPTSLPNNQPYKDPNSGYVLMPKMANKVANWLQNNPQYLQGQ